MSRSLAELGSAAHLWWVETGGPAVRERAADYLGLLSAEERTRWDGIRVERGREEYLVGRALLRTALSRYGQVDPAAWRFAFGERGKPRLETADLDPDLASLSFNLAHADGFVACIVTAGRAAGIDVEHPGREIDRQRLAERFFSTEERGFYSARAAQLRPEAFFAVWTLKEAYLKARGVGIGLPLRALSFVPESDGCISARFGPEVGDETARWQLDLWRAPSGHLVATALERREGERLEVRARAIVPLEVDVERPAPGASELELLAASPRGGAA